MPSIFLVNQFAVLCLLHGSENSKHFRGVILVDFGHTRPEVAVTNVADCPLAKIASYGPVWREASRDDCVDHLPNHSLSAMALVSLALCLGTRVLRQKR